jgi:hypothetical protein
MRVGRRQRFFRGRAGSLAAIVTMEEGEDGAGKRDDFVWGTELGRGSSKRSSSSHCLLAKATGIKPRRRTRKLVIGRSILDDRKSRGAVPHQAQRIIARSMRLGSLP